MTAKRKWNQTCLLRFHPSHFWLFSGIPPKINFQLDSVNLPSNYCISFNYLWFHHKEISLEVNRTYFSLVTVNRLKSMSLEQKMNVRFWYKRTYGEKEKFIVQIIKTGYIKLAKLSHMSINKKSHIRRGIFEQTIYIEEFI